jgi:hypothetical protein
VKAVTSSALPAVHPPDDPDAELLTHYCWRPRCRKSFERATGPGRHKDYCSQTCRRAAEKELRQARSRLADFEALVRQAAIDVAAFGRSAVDDADERLPTSLEAAQAAEIAVRRAEGVLVFADPDDLAVQELRKLYDAVKPVVLSERLAG